MSVEGTGALGPAPPGEIPQPGDVVGGKLEVLGVLGEGGMGVVLTARHTQLGQKVAIKLMRPDAAKSPEAVARFLREARAAVKLQSVHVARVTDVGTLDTGLPYMVMEHLQGTDLGGVLERRSALPVEEAVDYVLQAMEAIAEAHALGLVHRDLKPSNLFLTSRPDGSALLKVLDFGISMAMGGETDQQRLTTTSAMLGSPLYMSPEQVRSAKNVDHRTDVWALGVILYEAVSGCCPFEAETVSGLCAKIVADPPVPLRERRADLPRGFDAVVMRCLEKDVSARPQTVGELAFALRPFALPEAQLTADRIARIAGASRAAAPSRPDASTVVVGGRAHSQTSFADTVGATSSRAPVAGRRGKALALVLGGGLALVLGVVALVAFRASTERAAALAPPSNAGAGAAPPAPAPFPVPAAAASAEAAVTTSLAGASAASPASPANSAPSNTATALAPAVPRPTPKATATVTEAPTRASNCTPPYYVDSAGLRHYKPGCL